MKKLLGISTVLLALGVMLTGCASSGAKGDAAPSIPHPRTYVVDPADSKTEVEVPFNSYGPNYQQTIDMWSFLKKDKPQAGDTVQIRGRLTSDLDIPNIVVYLTDNSAAANYWTNLCDDNVLLDVKAGEPVDINFDVVLHTSAKGALVVTFAYDGADHGQESVAKVGKPAHFTFEKVADTTDTAAEVPTAPHKSEVTVNLGKYAAFLEIATNHPWINGAQDMSVISNYQATPEVTNAFGEDLPKAGDKITMTWKATADTNISKVYARPIDNSAAANWWKELIDPIWGEGDDTAAMDEQMLIAENIVAGEAFEVSKTFTLSQDAVAQVAFCIWYDCGAAEPDGPAICKAVRE